jgi:hypothetical protein
MKLCHRHQASNCVGEINICTVRQIIWSFPSRIHAVLYYEYAAIAGNVENLLQNVEDLLQNVEDLLQG